MGYQKRPSPLTPIKEAAYQCLLNNTEAGSAVFKNRPIPIWPIQLIPSGVICLYFHEGRADDRGQSFPTFYINESILIVECLVQAALDDDGNPTCDDAVELLAKEVFDILTSNRFLRNPITNEKTVERLKYSHYAIDLKGAMAEQVVVSYCLYFRVWFEETIGSMESNDPQPFQTADVKINTDKSNGDGHAGPESQNIFSIPQ